MKFFYVLLLTLFAPLYIRSQDTLIFKGLVMTQIDCLTKNELGPIATQGLYDVRFANFAVTVDSSFDYYGKINRAVFITSYCSTLAFDNYSLVIEMKNEFKPTKWFSSMNWDGIKLHEFTSFKTKRYWKKLNESNVSFYLMNCEFKYIPYKKIKFETANLFAISEKKAFITIEPMVYYITELISLEPVKFKQTRKFKVGTKIN